MRKKFKLTLLPILFLVLLTFSSCVVGYYGPLLSTWSRRTGTKLSNLTFGEWQDTSYDLYIPNDLNSEKNPALILFIHGGSYTGGDKWQEDIWCKFYASKGYITATINYSLISDKNPSNINLMNEQIKACVQDVKQKCLEYGHDVKQMALSGQSAGGHLSMLYAYTNATLSPIPVKFVFQQTGPTTFHLEYWRETEVPPAEVAQSATHWSGKTVTEKMAKDGSYKEIIDEISPASLVNADTVPTLCAYGPKDTVVPPKQKFLLFEQFDRYGVPYDYIEFPDSDHSMLSDPKQQELFIEKSLEYCELYFE